VKHPEKGTKELDRHVKETAKAISALLPKKNEYISAGMRRYWAQRKEYAKKYKMPLVIRNKSRFMVRILDLATKESKNFSIPNYKGLSELLDKTKIPEETGTFKFFNHFKGGKPANVSKLAYLVEHQLLELLFPKKAKGG
jgi:hypothetical protein